MVTASDVQSALADASDDAAAAQAARYFKTGEGDYGEGDVFIGVSMPANRKVARRFFDLAPTEIDALLWSEVHEHRMAALLILVEQFRRAPEARIVEQYLDAAKAGRVNNWDLVDASAEFILGEWLLERPRNLLFSLAKSDSVWERRIAIVSTYGFIKHGDGSTTLEIAEKLMREKHDLIQKAVGWMLREVGKRVDPALLISFLDRNAGRMPRTMLSYAVEHLEPPERARYRAVPRG